MLETTHECDAINHGYLCSVMATDSSRTSDATVRVACLKPAPMLLAELTIDLAIEIAPCSGLASSSFEPNFCSTTEGRVSRREPPRQAFRDQLRTCLYQLVL